LFAGKQSAQAYGDDARHDTHRPPQPEPKEFRGDGLSRNMAQARHAMAPVIGDPGIDQALRRANRRRGLGARPTVDDDALDNLATLGRGQDDRFGRPLPHPSPTREHAHNSARLRLNVYDGPAADLALQNLLRKPRQRGEWLDTGHPFQAVERQIARQAPPRLGPFLAWTHDRVDPE
jgi:hypothetical protein